MIYLGADKKLIQIQIKMSRPRDNSGSLDRQKRL